VALKSDAAAEKSKDQLSRDFPGRSIFDFCNNIVRITDSWQTSGQVRFVPIVLQKSFLADEHNFLGPLMRSARGDVRDHIVLHKNDHGTSYRA
jgi:hypothetical protein